MLKNSTDYCKDYLKNKHLILEKKWKKANELLLQGITRSSVCKQLNMNISILNKLLSLNNEELNVYFKNTLELRQEKKRSEKIELVNKTRDLYNNKHSMRKIAEILDLDRRTVKKYINPDFMPTLLLKTKKTGQ